MIHLTALRITRGGEILSVYLLPLDKNAGAIDEVLVAGDGRRKLVGRRVSVDHGAGSALVRFAFVTPLSASDNVPLALTSFMKFAAVTACASCAFTRPRSESVTTRFWFTSPSRNPMRTDPLPVPPPLDITLLTATVTYCWLVTPDNGTVIEFPLKVGVPATAVPAEIAAVPLVTG